MARFQSTPPRGWRHDTPANNSSLKYFNPLHHEGGDPPKWLIPICNWYFNPLHHEGGDWMRCCSSESMSRFQSTPPRGWRRENKYMCNPELNISIHSTTRVETAVSGSAWPYRRFQSTPPRGWRRSASHSQPLAPHFNPLHHEGGDPGRNITVDTPTYFNPLHHEGGDQTVSHTMGMTTNISIHSTTRVETFGPG